LPLPAHDLLKIKHYNEPFLPKPFALIQSARGCPYACNFCVRSYGTRLALRSPESIIEEIKLLIEIHDIKSFRFIDDTFTATSKRVIRFCKLIIENNIQIKWTCLSRADTLNEEMISWMKNAGCVRVYIGIESGSPKILKLINKEIDLDKGLENIRLLQKYMIQTTAFYMVGYPTETDEDFKMSLDYAIKANFDFVIPGRFIAYPGTKYFDDNKDQVDFELFPYKNEFKDKKLINIGIEREKIFYRLYYFRFGYVDKIWKNIFEHPTEILNNSIKAIKFQLPKKNKNVRNDYI
jgi:anaerobic magnesium-protoporphyrin IX monomethyl ester cyclase